MKNEYEDGTEREGYLAECVRIEPLCIEEEYVRMPADLAYWNERLSQAMRAYLVAKLEVDETDARLRVLHREVLLASGAKVTESQVDAAVTGDPGMHSARMRLIEAEAEKHRAGGIVDAIRTKRDMLISLGAHVRAEMQGDPVLRAQHRS